MTKHKKRVARNNPFDFTGGAFDQGSGFGGGFGDGASLDFGNLFGSGSSGGKKSKKSVEAKAEPGIDWGLFASQMGGASVNAAKAGYKGARRGLNVVRGKLDPEGEKARRKATVKKAWAEYEKKKNRPRIISQT